MCGYHVYNVCVCIYTQTYMHVYSQVSGAPSGFSLVSRGAGRCEVEHKYASVVGRIVKLWMAYKREKRRLQVCMHAMLHVCMYSRNLWKCVLSWIVKLWMACRAELSCIRVYVCRRSDCRH